MLRLNKEGIIEYNYLKLAAVLTVYNTWEEWIYRAYAKDLVMQDFLN